MRPAHFILIVAALAGACTMTVELAAVRLIAPWYGTSTAVWTNVIGVILLALSIGYLLGAKLSSRPAPGRKLSVCLIAAGACAAWLPALTFPLAGCFLPSGLALDEAADLLTWGSLASAIVLFVPCTVLLGCVPPLATEVVQRSEKTSAGGAGGRVLAASTVGSLAGTFSTSYLTLPEIGLKGTFLAVATLLCVLGSILWFRVRAHETAGLVLLLAPWLAALPGSRLRLPALPAGSTLLESVETRYQSARVVELEEGASRMRQLQVNEGFDSFQSVWQPEAGFLPAGFYYNLFALPAWWSPHAGSWRVLVIGLGAGTAWRVLEGALPADMQLEATGVEIDAEVVRLGQRWMQLPEGQPGRRVLAGWDGRAALSHLEGRYDQIILDAYANQMEIPTHLSTREFFSETRQHLSDRGWLCINVGAFGLGDPVVEAIGSTLADAFDRRALAVRVPFSRNCVLFARNVDQPPAPEQDGWYVENASIDRRLSALAIEGGWRWFDPGAARILTDDTNDIERLQQRSIAEGKSRWLGQR